MVPRRLLDRSSSWPMAAMSKRKRHCGSQRASIQHSQMPGTILATYWTSEDALKPPSSAYAQRCGSRLTTLMQCSTSPCYCSEQTNMLRRQIIGVAISPVIVNPNGLHGLADH